MGVKAFAGYQTPASFALNGLHAAKPGCSSSQDSADHEVSGRGEANQQSQRPLLRFKPVIDAIEDGPAATAGDTNEKQGNQARTHRDEYEQSDE